jgi:MFS family permease
MQDSGGGDVSKVEPEGPTKQRNARAMKWVFALEYVMQGLSNPFQGVTVQPFFRHFHLHYGLTEAATQSMFAQAYLAWSFKPLLGFLVDAYGRTRTLMIGLLLAAAFGYLVTPLIDVGPMAFVWSMFMLSVVLAGTDVTVDRATVIDGAEQAESTGKSKATTVGLNQAICWLSIFGSSILASALGGYVAEHVPFNALMMTLALVPLGVLLAALRLPKDSAKTISVKLSMLQFWRGINTGPVLAVMVFFFTFKFQPSMGPLWTNYLLEHHKFTQSQAGFADAAASLGGFLGVVLFARYGVHWQEKYGMRRLFKVYLAAMPVVSLIQFFQIDPLFSQGAEGAQWALPFLEADTARLVYLCFFSIMQSAATYLVDMSTFSLVGSVVPTAAAGSLFAGFMSVANLGYSFSYASGAWLYEHGLSLAPLRAVQGALFGVPELSTLVPEAAREASHLAIGMLVLINAVTFLGSYALVGVLPERKDTLATEGSEVVHPGPERWLSLPVQTLRVVDVASLALGVALALVLIVWLQMNPISSVIVTFFSATFVRKVTLDRLLLRAAR